MQVHVRVIIAVFGSKLRKNLYLKYTGSNNQTKKPQNNKKKPHQPQTTTTTVFKEKLQLFTLCFTYSVSLFALCRVKVIKDYLSHGTIYTTKETSKE